MLFQQLQAQGKKPMLVPRRDVQAQYPSINFVDHKNDDPGPCEVCEGTDGETWYCRKCVGRMCAALVGCATAPFAYERQTEEHAREGFAWDQWQCTSGP